LNRKFQPPPRQTEHAHSEHSVCLWISSPKAREIRAEFDGGAITSDGGGLLRQEVETDYPNPDLIEHTAKGAGGPESLWSGPGI
jgi:hypothetical protein